METIILTITIICFLTSIFWLAANVTGKFIFKVFAKITGIAGTVLPIIYWLKIANLI